MICSEPALAFLVAQPSSSTLALRPTNSHNTPTSTSSSPTSVTTKLHLLNLLQQEQEDAPNGGANTAIPYIIDRVSDRPNDRVFEEIADMCIQVFFNEDDVQTP